MNFGQGLFHPSCPFTRSLLLLNGVIAGPYKWPYNPTYTGPMSLHFQRPHQRAHELEELLSHSHWDLGQRLDQQLEVVVVVVVDSPH